MYALSFLSVLAFIIYLYLGVYVLLLDKKSRVHKMFFLLCLNFANWAFSYAFIYPAKDIETCWFWYRMTVFGWCSVNSFLLHFFILLTKNERLLKSLWSYVFLYTPPIIFAIRVISNKPLLVTDFGWSELGRVEIQTLNTIWPIAFIIYFVAYLVIGFSMLYIWGKKSNFKREKRQAHLVFSSAIFPIATGLPINIFLPAMGISKIPAIAPILIVTWMIGIWYSIVKYRFMYLTPEIASDEIMSKINDILIMVDNEGKIVKVNPSFYKIFSYNTNDLNGRDIQSIVLSNIEKQELFASLNKEVEFSTKDGQIIPVSISAEKINDTAGDIVGAILVGQDLRPKKQLQREIIERKQTATALRNLLDSAGQGFLSFSDDLLIEKEYSLECEYIFGMQIEGKYLPIVLYPNDKDGQDYICKLLQNILYEQNEDKRNIYISLLPDEICINGIYIKLDFKIIPNILNMKSLKYMLVLTDITDKKALQSQMENEKKVLKMVVNIVVNYNDFIENIKDYKKFSYYEIYQIIKEEEKIDDIISDIYRAIHTFKGTFSQFDMINTVKKLHDFESMLSDLRKNMNSFDNHKLSDFISTKSLESWIDEDLDTLKNILGADFFKDDNQIKIDYSKIVDIENKVASLIPTDEGKLIINDLKKLRYKSLKVLLRPYIKYVDKLAQRLKKSIYNLYIAGDDIQVDPLVYHHFIRSLSHVFRNALDHGIECDEDRIAFGKNPSGTIMCSISCDESNIKITISDDGRGIDFESLAQKAKKCGIEYEDKNMLIFAEGISTNENVSEYSGRGIGLFAVYNEIVKLNGKISVESTKGNGTSFHFILPYVENHDTNELGIKNIMNPLIKNTIEYIKDTLKVQNIEHCDDYNIKKIDDERLGLLDVTAFISTKGILEGTFIISISKETAKKLVRNFVLGEISPDEENEFIEDTLAETFNIIMGNSLPDFPQNLNLMLIQSPSVIFSRESTVKYQGMNSWTTDLKIDGSDILVGFVKY